MYTALLTKATGNTGIYWASTCAEKLKQDVEPFFESLKLLRKANLTKGVLCIRFYKDGCEEHYAQWGSI